MDKVAIITPCYNRAHTLRETAESVLKQSYKNWEWIIVDDGSSDQSWDLIQSFCARDERILGFKREHGPKGANTCRNIGAERATADWIIFLDSDDILSVDCLKQRLSFTKNKPKSEVYYFPTVIFKASIDEGKLWDDPAHPMPWLESLLRTQPPCQSTGPFWSKTAWEKYGGWTPGLQVWQDIDLHLQAYWKGAKFAPAKGCAPDCFHRVSKDSISRVAFHSQEKLESRVAIVQAAASKMRKQGFSEIERQAFARMALSVVQNGSNLCLFQEMKSIIHKLDILLYQQEKCLAHKIIWCRKYKIDRIPYMKRLLTQEMAKLFPKTPRSIGTSPWSKP